MSAVEGSKQLDRLNHWSKLSAPFYLLPCLAVKRTFQVDSFSLDRFFFFSLSILLFWWNRRPKSDFMPRMWVVRFTFCLLFVVVSFLSASTCHSMKSQTSWISFPSNTNRHPHLSASCCITSATAWQPVLCVWCSIRHHRTLNRKFLPGFQLDENSMDRMT